LVTHSSGLVVTVVNEITKSNPTTVSWCVYCKYHCNLQPWTWAAHANT